MFPCTVTTSKPLALYTFCTPSNTLMICVFPCVVPISAVMKLIFLLLVIKKGCPFTKKKYIYRINDKKSKRILAINEDLNKIKNKSKKKVAASKKKKRFNILRLYRKYKDKKGCKRLTNDMKYLDKKYGLGKTKKIC